MTCLRYPSFRSCLALLVAAGLTAIPGTAGACTNSEPPPPFCGKTLVLSQAVPGVILLPGGGTFDVSTLVFFNLLDFPPGFGICPPGPYSVTVDLTATCTPGPDGGGMTTSALVTGFNTIAVPVTVPAGPPRICNITGTATVTLADGMVLTNTSDNVVCLAEPAPGNPGLPRLDLQLVTPEIAQIHPGDQALYTYRITNNDPAESFSGDLSVEMVNTARMPGASGPMPPGTGPFSVSDPVEGDNFPIAFPEDLFEGCIVLPPDPTSPAVPLISQPIALGPGETIDVDVFSRPWGMCADGSCGRAKAILDGTFTNETSGLACAGFITAADTSAPPTYLWPDAGEVAEWVPGGPPEVAPLMGQPLPGENVSIDFATSQAQMAIKGLPVPIPPNFFSDQVEPERGRTQIQFVDPKGFAVDSFFDVALEIDVAPSQGQTFETEMVAMDLIAGAPTGFESTAPAARGLIEIAPPGLPVDSFFDFTYQIQVVGIDEFNDRRKLNFPAIQIQRRPDGSGFMVNLQGGQVAPGKGSTLQALEITQDFRGFLSEVEQGQLGEIFIDGFESGNVSAWSSSNP